MEPKDNAQKSSPTRRRSVNCPQSNSSPVVGFSSANHFENCNGRLSTGVENRPHVQIALPDFDCKLTTIPEKRSSQLSKTLVEVLKDKDALAYFIPYLEVRGAVSLVRFWLEAETFRMSCENSSRSLQLSRQSSCRSSACKREADSTDSPLELSSFKRSNSPSERANDCLHDNWSADTKQNYSGAHGHCRDIKAVSQHSQQNTVSLAKSNYTDTGASDPQRGLGDVSTGDKQVDACCTLESCAVTSGSMSANDPTVDTTSVSESFGESSNPEELSELVLQSVEQDAVAIFSKYLSHDCPCPISVTDALRHGAVHRICRGAEEGVDLECFSECQQHVINLLNAEYFPEFRQSVYHCNHQINVLTGSELSLADVLYDDTAFSYFTEFMEADGATDVLQCYLDLDNFQHLMATLHESNESTALMQGDSVILYDKLGDCLLRPFGGKIQQTSRTKDALVAHTWFSLSIAKHSHAPGRYFSLQATRSLRFEEHVRKEVENNMSREDGVLLDCFATPRRIIYCYIEQLFLPQFLKSSLYFKYLSDLINTVHCSQDVVLLPRRRRGSDTVSERSSGSAGNDSTTSRNTLLAMDSRGHHMKQAMNKVNDDMRIDSSFFDPDNLWQRPKAENKMTFGRVNELGQFISDFDPGPAERDKKGLGRLFAKRSEKSRTQEEMALQVAQMILNDVAMATSSQESKDGSSARGPL